MHEQYRAGKQARRGRAACSTRWDAEEGRPVVWAAEEGWLSRAVFPDSKIPRPGCCTGMHADGRLYARWFGEEPDPHHLMRSLPALRHGKNVMKIHFLCASSLAPFFMALS